MGGLSGLDQIQKNKQNKQDRLLAAQTQQLSPWTGLKAEKVGPSASPITAGIAGYTSGKADEANAAMAQAMQNKALAETRFLDSRTPQLPDPVAEVMGPAQSANGPSLTGHDLAKSAWWRTPSRG